MVVTSQRDFESEADVVFAYLTDPEKMQRWMRAKIAPKDPEAELFGLGSVRRVNTGLMSFDETITAYDAPHLCEYTAATGCPFKEYKSRFELEGAKGSCRITWQVTVRTRYRFLDTMAAFVIRKFTLSALNKLGNRLA